jgi:hypothetical protein
VTVQLRNGTEVADPRLGRLPLFDPASRNYQIRELLAATDLRATHGKYWLPGPTLDQGREGQCVSESTHDARNGSPIRTKPVVTAFSARHDFYHECQHKDPWPGCELGPACPIEPSPTTYGGTAVLTAAQLGKERGWWREYRWLGAGSGRLEDDLIETLATVGGIVFGIPWRDSMYETSPSGLVDVSGKTVGGHAIHGWEWAPTQRMPAHWSGTRPGVWWHNSWGPSYGVSRRGYTGCGFILLDDLLGLLADDGEGMVPIE